MSGNLTFDGYVLPAIQMPSRRTGNRRKRTVRRVTRILKRIRISAQKEESVVVASALVNATGFVVLAGIGGRNMRRIEQGIHQAVVAHLNLRAEPKVFFWHTPNEGKRGWVNAAHLKAMGMTAGVPDLLILKGGKLYALELKAPGGRLSPSQRGVMERMAECGAVVALARSIDEALVTLEFWGILKRNSSHRVPDSTKDNTEAA